MNKKGRKKGVTSNTTLKDPIIEPYYIQMDENNYALYISLVNDGGKESSTLIGYYPNLGSCLRRIAERKTKINDYSSLKEFMYNYNQEINKINQSFNL
jgi:hypothetical protein